MSTSDDSRPILRASSPKHVQIASHFRRRIEAGELAPGSKVESGRTIAEHFGVARPTANRALDLLRQWGLVSSHPGLGTFVLEADELSRDDVVNSDVATRLGRLEDQVARLGPLDQRLIDLPALRKDLGELAEAVGILQAQMIELRDHVGIDRRAGTTRQQAS